MIENIKRKIAALLEKRVENGATKEEAEAALRKAAELMAEYMIDEKDLQDRQEPFIEKKTAFRKTKATLPLDPVLERLFCVQAYFNNIGEHWFFGRESDVDLAIYFYNVILDSMERETRVFRKTEVYKDATDFLYTRHTVERDFQNGFMMGVWRQVEKLVNENSERTRRATGTDLVVVRGAEVENAFNKKHDDCRTVKTRKIKDTCREITKIGVSIGEKQNLRRGISEQQERGLLK